jgi:hypothetical protein
MLRPASIVLSLSEKARRRRASLFRSLFSIDRSTKILDIGSEDGSNVHTLLDGIDHDPQNISIADIDEGSVRSGERKYGFKGVLIDEAGPLPFDDNAFDIVYCSSVIEHVTVDHDEIWDVKDGRAFRAMADRRQEEFAAEIRRLAPQYFVQTPAASFPIESHTWLPLAGYLPRRVFVPFLRFTNQFWIKQSIPDFNLLTVRRMRELFPDSRIETEKVMALTKSIMAIKTNGVQ